MTKHQEFDADLDGTKVRCQLELPEPRPEEGSLAVVMVCRGLPSWNADTDELHTRIADALAATGLAAATVGRRLGDRSPLAVESIDDAAAVFHALALRDDLDLNRIGVLGHSIGAIVAACLARRTDQIARLCLLAPVTATEVVSRLNSETAQEVASRLGGTDVPPDFFDGLSALTPVEDLAIYDRPTLIVAGAADRTVSPSVAAEYANAIRAAGHEAGLVQVALADHVFSGDAARTACVDQLTRFFAATGRPEVAAEQS